MKVELQSGDCITIPDGCKAQINGNEIIVEEEKKEEAKTQEFKDGDVLTALFDNKVVFIFKEDELKQKDNRNGYYVCHTADYVLDVFTKGSPLFCGCKEDVRLATNEEKQFLFDKMKEQGLRWNAKEKKVEKIRWRAEDGKVYYYVDNQGVIIVDREDGGYVDQNRHEFGNYFRTREQAEEAIKQLKETLRKFHEELGE